MIKEWLIESSSDFQCVQVTTHRHERYEDPLVSISKFKHCQLAVITLDQCKPVFDFRLIPSIKGRYYGIDIHGDGANNIRNIDVSALPSEETGMYYLQFPRLMPKEERNRIADLTENGLHSFYLYQEEEGWEEELFSLWLLGDIKLFIEADNDYEIVRPPLYCRAVNFFSSLITPIK
jgi:hypothetical protein